MLKMINFVLIAMMVTMTTSASSFLRALDENINRVPTMFEMVSDLSQGDFLLTSLGLVYRVLRCSYRMDHMVCNIWYAAYHLEYIKKVCESNGFRTICLIKIQKWHFQIVLVNQRYLNPWSIRLLWKWFAFKNGCLIWNKLFFYIDHMSSKNAVIEDFVKRLENIN